MKRLITLAVLLATGCSASVKDVGSTTLQPLPTQAATLPPTDYAYTPEQTGYLDDTYYFYQGTPTMSDDELIEIGELWCQLMTDGMTAPDIISRINEGAIDNDDAKLHFSMVAAAGQNLCTTQFATIEEIALTTTPGTQP